MVSRRMYFEYLEPRNMLSVVDFLRESVNLYSVSRNSIDFGLPVVPIYTDFNAGGTYMSSVYADGVHLDGNDPNVNSFSGGTSSCRMTVNSVGTTGWFQFNTDMNRPRDIPDFGNASELRFLARGDKSGQQLKVKVVGDLPGNVSEKAWVRTLSTGWANYVVTLPAGLRPSDIDAVQFVLGDGLNQGNGTVRLDEVRIGVDGFDRLRLAQSYRPAGWVDNTPEPPVGSTEERDLTIYPGRAFLYDQALVIKALLRAGDVQPARDVADAILSAGAGDGSYYNERTAGHVLKGDGTPRDSLSATQTLGDNAWFGLALIDLYRVLQEMTLVSAT